MIRCCWVSRSSPSLITRRSLVQVQLAPFFSSLSETTTYAANFPQKFPQISSSWGSIGGIANHNSSKILTPGNNLIPFSFSPPFPPIPNFNFKKRGQYIWKQLKDFRIDRLLLPSFQTFCTLLLIQIISSYQDGTY